MVLSIHVSEWGKRNSMAKKKLNDNDFDLVNLPIEAQDPEISKEDFVLQASDNESHEQKFQTKPTTFLKDSLRRFSKNKSSVVAAGILGGLLLLSIFVPIFDRNDTSKPNPSIIYLEPKLFNAGTGFWDGTKEWKDIPVDTSKDPEGKDKEANWDPNPNVFVPSAVSNKKFTELEYTNEASTLGNGGYVHIGYYENIADTTEFVVFQSADLETSLDINQPLYLTSFDTYDSSKIGALESDNLIPENYALGEAALYLNYVESGEGKSIELIPYKSVHNIGSAISSLKEDAVNLSEVIKAQTTKTTFDSPSFAIRVKNKHDHQNNCVLVKSLEFMTESSDAEYKAAVETPSFKDATECINRGEKDPGLWSSNGIKKVFKSKIYYCTFTYDVYEAKLGKKTDSSFPISNIKKYSTGKNATLKWRCDTKVNKDTGKYEVNKDTFLCQIIDKDKCPLAEPVKAEDVYLNEYTGTISGVKATYYQYRELGYDSMPRFLFGTDKSGRDMFKYVFEGLRTSLLLGIITAAVCFIFGLIYGAISGYFGGTVDLVMERFTDILAGVPWIVVMTLVIIHLGSSFITFAIALCLTGWIGTAATTRTQFYRFRGREYVLASRTLGASDARLIAKHILTNAMGTIITSAVLMVPSIIFSEATISYLGLGLKNLASLGVILSNNQSELSTNAYLLLFPSVIIALVMISFNLFGNGLRDAVNPSLKGEDE